MKKTINPWVILGSLAFIQLIATYWCVDRVDRATRVAAKEILDSMRLDDSIRHVLDDTLHLNASENPDSAFRSADCLVDTIHWKCNQTGTVVYWIKKEGGL